MGIGNLDPSGPNQLDDAGDGDDEIKAIKGALVDVTTGSFPLFTAGQDRVTAWNANQINTMIPREEDALAAGTGAITGIWQFNADPIDSLGNAYMTKATGDSLYGRRAEDDERITGSWIMYSPLRVRRFASAGMVRLTDESDVLQWQIVMSTSGDNLQIFDASNTLRMSINQAGGMQIFDSNIQINGVLEVNGSITCSGNITSFDGS